MRPDPTGDDVAVRVAVRVARRAVRTAEARNDPPAGSAASDRGPAIGASEQRPYTRQEGGGGDASADAATRAGTVQLASQKFIMSLCRVARPAAGDLRSAPVRNDPIRGRTVAVAAPRWRCRRGRCGWSRRGAQRPLTGQCDGVKIHNRHRCVKTPRAATRWRCPGARQSAGNTILTCRAAGWPATC